LCGICRLGRLQAFAASNNFLLVLVGAHLINYPAKALPACRARDGTLRKDGLKVIEEERLRYGKKKNDFGDPA
jgi:hypothetical protein